MIQRSRGKLQTSEEFGVVGLPGRPAEEILLPEIADSREETEETRLADGEQEGRTAFKKTVRFDIGLLVTKKHFAVERRFTRDDVISAETDTGEHGPPGYRVTWNALSSLVALTVSYAIPANRLAVMLSNDFGAFSSGQITRMLEYAANLCLEIYIGLGEEISEVPVALGDDSPTNVTESLEESTKDGELVRQLDSQFGSQSLRRDGEGLKKQVNLSFVCGQTVPDDSRSWIFFFRTHMGSVGNLLSRIFSSRKRKNKTIKVQSDLSSSNKLESMISQLFDVVYAGCSAHARRPFWRNKDDDPGLCYYLLSCFALLARLEQRVRAENASPERIVELRQRHGRKIWQLILKKCREAAGMEPPSHEAVHVWPADSPLGKAVRYVVKNQNLLEAYLSDAGFFMTNNLCERLIRRDVMMKLSSKFRRTKKGRAVFDILQTITATCTAAGVRLRDYLPFVFANREDIQISPQDYTPYAFCTRPGWRAKRPHDQHNPQFRKIVLHSAGWWRLRRLFLFTQGI